MKLLDIGSIYDDPKRTITVTNGKETITTFATLTLDSDYKQEWKFTAFGQKKVMYAELYYEPGKGTCLRFGIR